MSQLGWRLPHDLLATSIAIMRPHGVARNEGLALWLGTTDAATRATVTHVVEVSGAGFVTSPQYLALSFRALAALTELAERLGVYLVGQIHSHPGRFIDLSPIDIAQGIRVPNYLSLVCPYYAQRARTSLDECGIHVFESGNFRRLPRPEARRRIVIDETSVIRTVCEVRND